MTSMMNESEHIFENTTRHPELDYGDNENTTSGSSSPYMMPWPQKLSWISIFTLMLVVATVGNALVTWIVLAHRRMKTVTNYFLVNLSLADLTMSLFNCIFNFTFMLNSHWPFGGFYCTVSNFIANVTVAASVFTLVAISFDRYIAIVFPLRPRMSKSVARIAISLIWLASCCLAVPCLLYSQTLSHRNADGEVRIACLMIWPDGLPNVSQQDFIYNIVFTVLTYLMPVTVMAVCYTRMSFVLWRSKAIGEQISQQEETILAKRKVVRMFIVVVFLFTVCWLPYHGYFVYQYIDRDVISYRYIQHIFLAFYWLAMSNAMINPLVYYYMNTRFRQYFKTVICQCPRRRSATTMTAVSSTNSRRRGRQSQSDGRILAQAERRTPRSETRMCSSGRKMLARLALPNCRGKLRNREQRQQQQQQQQIVVRFTERQMVTFHHITQQVNQTLLQVAQQPRRHYPAVGLDLTTTPNNSSDNHLPQELESVPLQSPTPLESGLARHSPVASSQIDGVLV